MSITKKSGETRTIDSSYHSQNIQHKAIVHVRLGNKPCLWSLVYKVIYDLETPSAYRSLISRQYPHINYMYSEGIRYFVLEIIQFESTFLP